MKKLEGIDSLKTVKDAPCSREDFMYACQQFNNQFANIPKRIKEGEEGHVWWLNNKGSRVVVC